MASAQAKLPGHALGAPEHAPAVQLPPGVIWPLLHFPVQSAPVMHWTQPRDALHTSPLAAQLTGVPAEQALLVQLFVGVNVAPLQVPPSAEQSAAELHCTQPFTVLQTGVAPAQLCGAPATHTLAEQVLAGV